MTPDEISDMIKRHEGGPSDVYLDSVGIPTLGWGHALHPGSAVPLAVSKIFFAYDFENAVKDAEFIIAKYNLDLDPVRKAVLIDMSFQLGISKLMEFKKMLAALKIQNYGEAASEIWDSKAAHQCQNRYRELVSMMKTGKS